MARQKNWELGRKKKSNKTQPEVLINTKKAWSQSGGWRTFWKNECDQQNNPHSAVVREFRQQVKGTAPEWLMRILTGLSNLGELVLRLKGNSFFSDMSSQDLNELFRAAIHYHSAKLIRPCLNSEVAYLLIILHDVFIQECAQLAKSFSENGVEDAPLGFLAQFFSQTQTVDEFADKIEALTPDYEAAAESLRPFLRELAELFLAKRLVKDLENFAKLREKHSDDYIEL